VQPSSTLSEKAMRKLPRWVQSRTRLGRHLALQDIAEITRTIRASRAEAGPRIVHTIDAVQVVPPASLACLRESSSAHILSWLRHTGSQFACGCWCVAGDWRRSSWRLFPSAGRVYQRSPAVTSCSLIPKPLPHPQASTAHQTNRSLSWNSLRLA
jgi:hypothetical protein